MSGWFFMSYASADGGKPTDPHVQAFYSSLEEEIRTQVADTGPLGFLDAFGLKIGDDWGAQLAAAIRECHTFVPLVTARYFTRPYCGHEWGGFEQRSRATGPAAPNHHILPVIWGRPPNGGWPEFSSKLHVRPPADKISAGARRAIAEYKDLGLLHLLKRIGVSPEHKLAYIDFVAYLAGRIVELGRQQALPKLPLEALPQITDAPRRFPVEQDPPHAPTTPSLSGVPAAHFSVLAGRLDEMSNARANAGTFYGAESRAWRPFGDEQAVFRVVQEMSNVEEVICEWLDGRDQLPTRVRDLEKTPLPVVIIVDPWSSDINEYARNLSALDQMRFDNCVILMVWDLTGADAPRSAALKTRIQSHLGRWSAGGPTPFYNDKIQSVADLRDAVGQAIRDLRNRLVQRMDPVRVATGKARYHGPPSVR